MPDPTTIVPPPDPAGRRMATSIARHGPRYSAVSGLTLLLGHAALGAVQVALPDRSRALATAVSTVVCAGPTYYANRVWVWSRRGSSSWRREIAPYWLWVGAGLVATTGGVAAVERWWSATQGRALPLLATNLVATAAMAGLWALRFVWMDRAFSGREDHGVAPG